MADSRSSEKTTGVGGEQRASLSTIRRRFLPRTFLLASYSFVVRTEVHSAKVMDQGGIEMLLRSLLWQADKPLARPNICWRRLRGEDGDKDWAEMKLECSVELLRRPHKPTAESLLVA